MSRSFFYTAPFVLILNVGPGGLTYILEIAGDVGRSFLLESDICIDPKEVKIMFVPKCILLYSYYVELYRFLPANSKEL